MLARSRPRGGGNAVRAGDPRSDHPAARPRSPGIKNSIVRHLRERGARVERIRAARCAEQCSRASQTPSHRQRPRRPAALAPHLADLASCWGKTTVWGICLGHRAMRAVGLETLSSVRATRANHRVKDFETGAKKKIDITSQNQACGTRPDGEQTNRHRRGDRWATTSGRRDCPSSTYDRPWKG